MQINPQIKYAQLNELFLDPLNPRLGRNNTSQSLSQRQVMDLMRDFSLDELAVSYLESGGFWPQEAMLITHEVLYGKKVKVVIEGNRRLAALLYLHDALAGKAADKKWREIARSAKPNSRLFSQIPYIEIGSRKDIEAFLGFRHVTGIKQWEPPEKAEYIAKLIDERGFSYEQVMRKIGSTTQAVRQNYISYRMLLQIEETVDSVPLSQVEERFSVMYLSLRTKGVQRYLHIDILADPKTAKKPVPKSKLKELEKFAQWLFGTKDRLPFVRDSRQIDDFGAILESGKAIEYLERESSPSFEVAYRLSGGDEPQVIRLIEEASDKIELSLARVHAHRKSAQVLRAVRRVGEAVTALLDYFPEIRDDLRAGK